MKSLELKPNQLRYQCNQDLLGFETTADVEPVERIIGQERATKAMEFGLRLKNKSYNIYVAGITGTGKTSYVTSVIKKLAGDEKNADDWCYVYNFKEVDCPVSIKLPAGMGEQFVKDMEWLVEELRRDIPGVFTADDYRTETNQLIAGFHTQANQILLDIEKEAKEKGVVLRKSDKGVLLMPLLGDKLLDEIPPEEITEDMANRLQERVAEVQQDLEKVMRKVRNIDREAEEALQKMEQEMVKKVIKPDIEKLRQKYSQYNEKLLMYFEQVEVDILENLDLFKKASKKKSESQDKLGSAAGGRAVQNFFNRYSVNLFVNNANCKGVPVEIETNPNYYRLFGKIEGRPHLNNIISDFTTIKSGAIHRANGGYLIIQVTDILKDAMAWDALKRTIQTKQAVIENIGEQFKAVPSTTVKPEPIPLEVKVILIGSPSIHHLLYNLDEDFQKLFKIKVQFDTVMDRDINNLRMYAQFVSSVCCREGFCHFHKSAVAKIIELGSYMADEQEKLSTRFNHVVEIIYEAAAWAEIEGAAYVMAAHVQKAFAEKVNRASLVEDKMREKILDNNILIDTTGKVVGQVNGLTVYNVGDHTFGFPAKITARTYIGENGVINIEREAKMSGAIHNKGVLILEGYLGGQYAGDKPLSLSASICFEQSYGGIDGDSATCAELLALLSSIGGIPIRQNLAITGSMNQLGAVQPIGGVNQKIEGFFQLCKDRGFTGEQGVIIPSQNQKNLMLPEAVVNEVAQGNFRIYAISHIDEAIELLTGLEAKTVHQKVDQKLAAMAAVMKNY
jgi:lon-related putative ATP-dependent protease